MPKTKVGDRVRVTYEVEVTHRSDMYLVVKCPTGLGTIQHTFYRANLPKGFKVEVLEPAVKESPVEVFQPGDIVQGKSSPVRFQLLPGDKYMDQAQRQVYDHIPGFFTSKKFTKVGHINELLKS